MIGPMGRGYVLAPSILAADFLALGEAVKECESAGADWLHIDVMDGRFVPNLTMGPAVVEACRRATSLPLDVHLRGDEPGHLLGGFAAAGARIQVGGGIDRETAPRAAEAGAEIFVAGVSVFQHPMGITQGVHAIQSA